MDLDGPEAPLAALFSPLKRDNGTSRAESKLRHISLVGSHTAPRHAMAARPRPVCGPDA